MGQGSAREGAPSQAVAPGTAQDCGTLSFTERQLHRHSASHTLDAVCQSTGTRTGEKGRGGVGNPVVQRNLWRAGFPRGEDTSPPRLCRRLSGDCRLRPDALIWKLGADALLLFHRAGCAPSWWQLGMDRSRAHPFSGPLPAAWVTPCSDSLSGETITERKDHSFKYFIQ